MDSLLVQDHMDRQTILLSPELSIEAALVKLLDAKKTGAPVVDKQGTLMGFLSEQDCLSVMLKSTYHCDLLSKVSDCMKNDVLTVLESDSIFFLAEQMLGLKPKIYPVIRDGKVIATIDRSQVLAAIAKHMKQSYLAQT